jgi:hypothetical protein
MKEHNCRHCGVKLDKNNWCPSYKAKSKYECKSCSNQKGRDRHTALRLEIISAYGGSCSCCGCQTIEFLAIDHLDNSGNKHRQEIGESSDKLYRWLKKNGFPKDNYTLNCHNCNSAKQYYGCCPHQKQSQNPSQDPDNTDIEAFERKETE